MSTINFNLSNKNDGEYLCICLYIPDEGQQWDLNML